jgi:hypothetical protein
MSDNSEIADLKRELAELKRKVEPEPIDWERRIAEHRDAMHQAAERRAAAWYQPSRDELAEYARATPDDCCRDLASHGTVQAPSTAGVSGTVSSVHPDPGLAGSHRGTGWVDSRPLGPVDGLRHMNNIGEAFAQRDKAAAFVEETRTAAVLKAIAESK